MRCLRCRVNVGLVGGRTSLAGWACSDLDNITSKSPTASNGGVRDMFRNSALTVALLLSFFHVTSAVPNRGKTY